MTDAAVARYYNRLTRWNGVARLLGYGGGRHALTVHRALADPNASGLPTTTRLHDIICEHVPLFGRSPRVFDAGCGFGGTMIDLAGRLGLGGTHVGVTLSPHQAAIASEAIERANLAQRVRVLVQSYDEPPRGPFDLILAIESLAHASSPERALAAWVRVLAPGGVVVIVDDMPEPVAEDSEDLQIFKRGWRLPVLWSRARYVESFRDLGLQLVADLDLTPECRPRPPYRIVALEALNRAVHNAVPSAPLREVMTSHRGGLALERLTRARLVRYRLLAASRAA